MARMRQRLSPNVETLESKVLLSVRGLVGFQAHTLARNDDGSTGLVDIGYTLNFFGKQHDKLYVNNNGNVTFDSPLSQYTPGALATVGREMIAPFFADVDTRQGGKEVTYGQDTIDGHKAFGVEWINVGYYNQHADKTDSFELVLIDRSDVGPGCFVIEFNYDRLQWETGDASGGSNGLGGTSACAGYSAGTGAAGTSLELPGSAVNGALINGGANSLVADSRESTTTGRYRFSTRRVDIDADIDRDGAVDGGKDELDEGALSKDEAGEEAVGTIVIRDKDNVYSDPNEPVRRREIVIRRLLGSGKVRVQRSSDHLRLYDARTGGAEKFGGQNEVALDPGTYWLQGGADASARVRGDELKVRVDKDDAPFEDDLEGTVIWADISGRNTNSESPDPIYDGFNTDTALQGHNLLGVVRSTATSTDTDRRVRGIIEIQGKLAPNDLTQNVFDRKLTSNFVSGNPAKADFGFIFRRSVTFRDYSNGQAAVDDQADARNDDSLRTFQDVDPDLSAGDPLIVDSDGPSATVSDENHFRHTRNNFDEHIAFVFQAGTSERVSENLKWAFSGDVAHDYNNRAVFIRSAPNGGGNINVVKVGSHLPNLNLGIAAPTLTSAGDVAGSRELKQGTTVVLTLVGSNLIGDVFLGKGKTEIKADDVQVRETDAVNHVSDLTEIRATFTIPATAQKGGGYTLEIRNAAGTDSLKGFKVRD